MLILSLTDDANVKELLLSPQLLRLRTMTVIQFWIISSLTAAPASLMRSKLASGTEGRPPAGKGRVSNESNGPHVCVSVFVRERMARLEAAES